MKFERARLIKKLQHRPVILHRVDRPQFNRMAFKLDRDAHFAAGMCAACVQETSLDAASKRRRTKAKKEVTCGGRKLKPITPPLKGEGLHTLFFLMQAVLHGVLDTST